MTSPTGLTQNETVQAAAYPDLDSYLMTATEFLGLHDFKGIGEYLNLCDDNAEDEEKYGTLALCWLECLIFTPGGVCEHGCPSATATFTTQIEAEMAKEQANGGGQ